MTLPLPVSSEDEMKEQCIEAVTRAAGRALSAAEIKGIEDRIRGNLRQLAIKDRAKFLGMSEAQRLQEAARLAADQMVADAVLKKERVAKQIQVHDVIDNYLQSRVNAGEDGIKALRRTLVFSPDGKGRIESVESKTQGVFLDAMRNLTDMFEQGKGAFFGLLQDRAGVEAIVRELHGEDTGVPGAKESAKAFKDTAEALRKQFNDAGGNIGRLEDWGMPQTHDQSAVLKATKEGWIAKVFGKLDRDRYVNEDGSVMTDPQLTDFLGNAWESIAWGGINKIEPGKFQGSGMRANQGAESRQIHFKDADSYIAYQQEFGNRSLYDTIVGHVKSIAKDIALVEKLGPNPNATFAFFRDKMLKESVEKGMDPGKANKEALTATGLYDFVAGRMAPVADEGLAAKFDTLRNWMIASRMGSAVVGSLSDEGTMALTAKVNNLPVTQLWRNELTAMNLANRTELGQARRAGLAWESAISGMNRWGQDNLGPSMSAKLANTTIRASGLSALTDVRKRAFGITMMDGIGKLTREKETLAALDEHDNRILLSKGITEEHWAVWRAAEPENWNGGNHTVLTPAAVYRVPDEAIAHLGDPAVLRRDAAQMLVGAVDEEINMAVITPGLEDRFQLGGAIQRGTWKGELARSVVLFKSFPWAMISRHWARGLAQDTTSSKAAYIATFVGLTTLMGGVALQINEMLQGKDPRNMDPTEKGGIRTGMAAMLKGGGLGLYGDFLFSEATQHQQNGPVASLLGPVAGLVENVMGLTQGNMVQAGQGKKTNAGAEAVQFVRSNTPFANLWYAKAALDHLIFQQLQEELSAGYNARMQRKALQTTGQSFWWQPGTTAPQRAPDLGATVGQ
jgi:hypothetical protein